MCDIWIIPSIIITIFKIFEIVLLFCLHSFIWQDIVQVSIVFVVLICCQILVIYFFEKEIKITLIIQYVLKKVN